MAGDEWSPLARAPAAKKQSALDAALPDSAQNSVAKKLQTRNFFNETEVATKPVLSPNLLAEALRSDSSLLVNGMAGKVLAAAFVNRAQRNDGDFRYASGENAFRSCMKAHNFLSDIPTGGLSKQLDVDLLSQVHELGFVHGDVEWGKQVYHFFRAFQSGGKVRAGVLRPYATNARPADFSHTELEGLTANGLHFMELADHGARGKYGVILYPPPNEVRPQLEALLAETRKALDDPGSDVVSVAAHFAQRFVAIHPFQDGNGRTGRLMMNRILAERGFPPPILANLDNDIGLSPAAFQSEVEQGIYRTTQLLADPYRYRTETAGAQGYGKTLLEHFGHDIDLRPTPGTAAPSVRIGWRPGGAPSPPAAQLLPRHASHRPATRCGSRAAQLHRRHACDV